MKFSQQQVEMVTLDIVNKLGDVFKWRWEEQRHALLTEFARDKKDIGLQVLRASFTDEWDKKTIKKAPKSLKQQLGTLTKLNKKQLLFTRPASQDQPALLAIWWPWEHGGTFSLRLVILSESYDLPDIAKSNFFWPKFLQNFFKKSSA